MLLQAKCNHGLVRIMIFFAVTLFLILLEVNAELIRPNGTDEENIVGGHTVTIEQFPWQVAIFDEAKAFFCGGSILTKRLVVTAQHCTISATIAYVGVGQTLMSSFGNHTDSLVPVESIIKYPQYMPVSEGMHGKDVTLVVLSRDLEFNDRIQPIRVATLQDSASLAVGDRASISGWGTVSFGQPWYPDQLRAAVIKIVSTKFALSTGVRPIFPDQIAAGQFPGAGNIDTCQGDSGGPLVVRTPSKKTLLAGLTSWGIGCADKKHPGVYSRLTHYVEWIDRAKIASDAAIPSVTSRSFVIAANVSLKVFSAKMYDILIPRGLRLARFVLEGLLPTSKLGSLIISSQGMDGFSCYQANGSPQPNPNKQICSFVMPLEGIMTITIASGRTPVNKVTLHGLFESFSRPRNAEFHAARVSLAANERMFLLGFPTLPESTIDVHISNLQPGSLNPRVVVGGRVTPDYTSKGMVKSDLHMVSKQTVASVVLIGAAQSAIVMDVAVKYETLDNNAGVTEIHRQGSNLKGPKGKGVMKVIVPEKLKVGSELSVRFYMVSGSAEISVVFNTKEEWNCQVTPPGELFYCSGLVPRRGQSATIELHGEPVKYDMTVRYEAM